MRNILRYGEKRPTFVKIENFLRRILFHDDCKLLLSSLLDLRVDNLMTILQRTVFEVKSVFESCHPVFFVSSVPFRRAFELKLRFKILLYDFPAFVSNIKTSKAPFSFHWYSSSDISSLISYVCLVECTKKQLFCLDSDR